jgi:hypothetical protein
MAFNRVPGDVTLGSLLVGVVVGVCGTLLVLVYAATRSESNSGGVHP